MVECNSSQSDLTLIEDVLQQYQDVSGSMIAILQKAQEIYGYLPTDVIYLVAERTGVSPAKIMGVATFYAQFSFEPIGKYLVMVCNGTACHVNGADGIMEAVSEELGVEDKQTTSDGLFTMRCVACLGCCSLSPVMMINEDTYGSLTPEKAKVILRGLRQKEKEAN